MQTRPSGIFLATAGKRQDQPRTAHTKHLTEPRGPPQSAAPMSKGINSAGVGSCHLEAILKPRVRKECPNTPLLPQQIPQSSIPVHRPCQVSLQTAPKSLGETTAWEQEIREAMKCSRMGSKEQRELWVPGRLAEVLFRCRSRCKAWS